MLAVRPDRARAAPAHRLHEGAGAVLGGVVVGLLQLHLHPVGAGRGALDGGAQTAGGGVIAQAPHGTRRGHGEAAVRTGGPDDGADGLGAQVRQDVSGICSGHSEQSFTDRAGPAPTDAGPAACPLTGPGSAHLRPSARPAPDPRVRPWRPHSPPPSPPVPRRRPTPPPSACPCRTAGAVASSSPVPPGTWAGASSPSCSPPASTSGPAPGTPPTSRTDRGRTASRRWSSTSPRRTSSKPPCRTCTPCSTSCTPWAGAATSWPRSSGSRTSWAPPRTRPAWPSSSISPACTRTRSPSRSCPTTCAPAPSWPSVSSGRRPRR